MTTIPTFHTNGATGCSSGGITPGLPSGWQINDIWLLCIETDNEPVTFPAGWPQIFSRAQGGSTQLQIAWRRATSSESAPTIADAGDHQAGVILGFRGCITSIDPFDVISAGANGVSDTPSAPSVTTATSNCLVIGFISTSGSSSFSSWTNSNLSGFVEILDFACVGGDHNDGSLGAAAGGLGTPGASGSISVDPTQANPGWSMTQIALKPELDPPYRPLRTVLGSNLRY